MRVSNFIAFTDKKTNFTGTTTVSIESPEMPTPIGSNKIISGNTLEFKLSTEAGLTSSAFYNDGTIPNSGPLPQTIDKETTYTVHWTVANAFNDLRVVEVKSVLPIGTKWMNKVFPAKSGLEYNERTREIIWNIERVPAGAGINAPTVTIVFQVGLTPSEDLFGKSPKILENTTLKGTDTFTQEVINKKAPYLDTTLPEDKSIIDNLTRVIRVGDL